jgi:hypothetical protein
MLENLLTAPNLFLLAIMAWCAFMMRNAAPKSRRSRDGGVEYKSRANQTTIERKNHRLEVRLHDYDRDVAARMETTMAMLDQLIAEGDEEIERLEALIETRQHAKPSSLSFRERRMVAHLARAGYSIDELARLTNRPRDAITEALNADPNQDRRAA